jgi:hypothetical protein
MSKARLLYVVLLFAVSGCSMRQIALNQTAAVLKDALPAFEREWDYELASQALPGSIKTIEGFLVSAPKNADLLLLLSRAYGAFGLAILEDRYEREKIAAAARDEDDSPAVERLRTRVKEMYLRAHRYGLRLMETRKSGFRAAFKKGREALKNQLAACDKGDVPALFWTTMPLATALNIGRDDVTLIAVVPKIKVVMKRIIELDEGYYYGGAHLVLGGLYGGVGKMLGGNAKLAKTHFERALALSKRRFLVVQEMYARTLAVQVQDKKLFRVLLSEVLDAKLKDFPEQMLANVAAKRRAQRTLNRIDELF